MRKFSQLQTEIFRQLKEENNDEGYWTTDEVKDAINDTYMFIADETFCFRLEHVIEIKANIRIYKMPQNYIMGSLYRVEFDDKIIYPVSSSELDDTNRNWRDTTGSDILAYFPPGDICEVDEIAVYPLPDTDGTVYNLASESENYGTITKIGDDSYEEFVREEGVIVNSDEAEVRFTPERGVVQEIQSGVDNLKVFGAKYPKRLNGDDEVMLQPISHNPRRVVTLGSLSILYAKEGKGKDIAKASFYNKRFNEVLMNILQRPKVRRRHVIRSITDYSAGFRLRLGENYPNGNLLQR